MNKFSGSPRDPFLITGERLVDYYVLETILRNKSLDLEGYSVPIPGPWEQDNRPIGGFRNDNLLSQQAKSFRQRIFVAALGAAFIVGPMWLMAMHNTFWTSLVSSTAFVVAFGILMAYLLHEAKEVMSSTAAYAAVLVVFVGLGMETEGSN